MAAFLADGPTPRMLFTVFAIWNAADVLINGIPFRGYVDNDAQNLLEMSRSQEAVRKHPMTRNEEEDKKFFREIREAYERRNMEEGQK